MKPVRYKASTSSPAQSPPHTSSFLRGSDISADDISKTRSDYWPGVEGWREHIATPLPFFSDFGVAYQLTGRDKVGKSHFASVVAAAHSKKHDVLYVTTEFPAQLVHQKLVSLGADPSHLYYLDYSFDPHNVLGVAKLGSGATPFHQTRFHRDFTSAVSSLSGDPILVVVDSATSFYEAQEWSGRLLVANLVRTIRSVPKVLAFVISQKRTQHSEYNTEVAGGLGVSHILDGTFILAKYRHSVFKRAPSPFVETLIENYGGAVRTFRWDGNRWGPHPEDEYLLTFRDNVVVIERNLTEYTSL